MSHVGPRGDHDDSRRSTAFDSVEQELREEEVAEVVDSPYLIVTVASQRAAADARVAYEVVDRHTFVLHLRGEVAHRLQRCQVTLSQVSNHH